jgi:hypothetical protein
MVIVGLTFLPMCFFRDLKLVSYLSMGGIVATVVTIALVVNLALSEVEDDEFRKGGWMGSFELRAEEHTALVGPKPFLPVSLLLYQVRNA